MTNDKVQIAELVVVLGIGCNMKCRHCYQGETNNLAIKNGSIDALVKKIYAVSELTVSGGEIALYLKEFEYMIQKFMEYNVRVNWLTVVTNGTIQSQKLIDLFVDFAEYTTYPDEAELRISNTQYHIDEKNRIGVNPEKNIDWYRNKLPKYCVNVNDYVSRLRLTGRAKKLCPEDWKKSEKVVFGWSVPSEVEIIDFKGICCGNENGCLKGGCVENCIRHQLVLNVDGDITLTEKQWDVMPDKNAVLANISDNCSLFDVVQKWNQKCRGIRRNNTAAYIKNIVESEWLFTMVKAFVERMKTMIFEGYNSRNVEELEIVAQWADKKISQWNAFLKEFKINSTIYIAMANKCIDGLFLAYQILFTSMFLPFFVDKKNVQCALDFAAPTEQTKYLNELYISYEKMIRDGQHPLTESDVERYVNAYQNYANYLAQKLEKLNSKEETDDE